MRAACTS